MTLRLLATLAFATFLGACQTTGTTTLEEMQRNQRMQMQTAA